MSGNKHLGLGVKEISDTSYCYYYSKLGINGTPKVTNMNQIAFYLIAIPSAGDYFN